MSTATRPHAITTHRSSGRGNDSEAPPSSPTSENVTIVSPMRGTVNIKTSKGEFVKEGDCIAEVVSVKSELQVKAPKAGFISRISVPDGLVLEENDVIGELRVNA